MNKIIEQGVDEHGAYYQVLVNTLTGTSYKRVGRLARKNSKNITWSEWWAT